MACSFSKAEAGHLMLALYKLILPTLGASKSLPNVYHFAPLSLQGLEAPNFYVEQGICKVSKLLTHGDSGNLTSNLIAVSMEQAQLKVGIGTPLLQAPFDQYGMLCTQCWVKGLWQFALEHCILLENPTYHTPHFNVKAMSILWNAWFSWTIMGMLTSSASTAVRYANRSSPCLTSYVVMGYISTAMPILSYLCSNPQASMTGPMNSLHTLTGICGGLPSRS